MAKNMSLKSAALFNAAGRYSKVVLALLVNAALARILTPGDFGIIAIVTVFTTLFTAVSDMGFGTAVVQRKDLLRSQIDDIFSFTGYMSLAIAIVFFLCGWPIAVFFSRQLLHSSLSDSECQSFFLCVQYGPQWHHESRKEV